MKKIKYLLLLTPLFLIACFQPPTPNVEEVIQNADPNTIVPLSNGATDTYFRTALPFVASPARGLIYDHIRNRADIGQVEMSLLRIATEHFDPDTYYFREGQHLTRELTSSLLRHYNPEPEFLFESARGLNPPIGTSIRFGNQSFEIRAEIGEEEQRIRPLAFMLESNFVTIRQNEAGENEFELEGVAIALALNPFYWERDFSTGFEQTHEMEDEAILDIGKEIARALLPQLRQIEALENVPILFGLYILRPNNSILPGRFTNITYVEEGRSSIRDWVTVHEQFFTLPDTTNSIQVLDIDINDQFIAFRDGIENNFPHTHGIVGRAHFVDRNLYRLTIDINMNFWSSAEKIAFFQLLEDHVMLFSREYDITITIRNINVWLGGLVRSPGGEPVILRADW